MNFKELHEGAEPKMPGAPSGIKIMTPQQFVASAGDSKSEEEVDEGNVEHTPTGLKHTSTKDYPDYPRSKGKEFQQDIDRLNKSETGRLDKAFGVNWEPKGRRKEISGDPTGVTEQQLNEFLPLLALGARLFIAAAPKIAQVFGKVGQAGARGVGQAARTGTEIAAKNAGQIGMGAGAYEIGSSVADITKDITAKVGTALDENTIFDLATLAFKYSIPAGIVLAILYGGKKAIDSLFADPKTQQGVAEGQEHLDRIRKLSGLGEATKLPAQTRDLDSQEFQDYMNRIVGTPDLDKSGNVKIDKKGNEKYTTGKTKGDKYKMPYIHRSSVVTYLSPDGKTYDEDAVKQTLAIRPKSLLKQNEKMKHSNGEFEQFFNVGFAALVGIALDEQTNKLIIVNTCPGAGSCKIECFAMKGGKIQFKAAWQSDGRILTYLLNDPDGFFNQLSSEISKEASAGAKGDKKFPDGWQTTVRWHDAGDFFSPEYLDMALKMAAKHPDVRFYAYTKMAGAALAKKPDNFIINWSEGANTTQEKQVKAQDPNLDTTKNSRIVPEKLFYDLLAKDEKGNLKKTDDGAWQPADDAALKEMKQRIATEYGISANSILSYTEYMAKRNSIPAGMKYNVIVAPGEGDVSANDPGVLSTLLLRH